LVKNLSPQNMVVIWGGARDIGKTNRIKHWRK
jgi:hypothetical protein